MNNSGIYFCLCLAQCIFTYNISRGKKNSSSTTYLFIITIQIIAIPHFTTYLFMFCRKPFHFESHGDSRMNNIIYVSMMIGVSEIFYHNNEELQFKAIGLPYKGNDYVAYFVLPNENISMRDLMNTINERTLRNITKSTILAEVTYFVPKMTLKSFTNLKPVLQVNNMILMKNQHLQYLPIFF